MKPTAERLDWRTLFEQKKELEPVFIAALDSYFECFAQPELKADDKGKPSLGDQPCIKCKKPLLGLTAFFLGGGFTWGLAHGEGFCQECKWPARAHHFIRDADGNDLITLRNMILQYHPDFVTKAKRDRAA